MTKKIHFISIGGSVMHNLAIALHLKGYHISGSDDEIYDPAKSRLAQYGILPENGWDEKKVTKELDAVIVGMHAKSDNPELIKAQQLDIPVYSFPEYMYEHAKDKTRIVVAGSHGKTTVTSMLLHIFGFWQRPASFLAGAQLKGFDTMVNLDEDAGVAIYEGDEYLASPLQPIPKFLFYQPNIAIITGIAWDHINAFPTYASYLAQFEKFIESMQPNGYLIYNHEDKELRKLLPKVPSGVHTVAYHSPRHRPVGGHLEIESTKGPITLPMLGAHNAANFEAARIAAELLDFTHHQIAEAMRHFSSPARRLEIVYQANELTIIRDFAHAPSKVQASVAAARQHFPEQQLVALLELHTFSSLTPDYLPHYHNTLAQADVAVVYLNPHALKKKGTGVDASMVAKAFDFPGMVISTHIDEIKACIATAVQPPSTILMMSSGNWGGEDWHDLPTFVLPEKSRKP
jgi:UDP-N-acetylmuramate: L-alanyl-gamma-D-glutamyl-meso-diaminopimelate ligase